MTKPNTFKEILETLKEGSEITLFLQPRKVGTPLKGEKVYPGLEFLNLTYLTENNTYSETFMSFDKIEYFPIPETSQILKTTQEPHTNLKILAQLYKRYQALKEKGLEPKIYLEGEKLQPINFSDLENLNLGYSDSEQFKDEKDLTNKIKKAHLKLKQYSSF